MDKDYKLFLAFLIGMLLIILITMMIDKSSQTCSKVKERFEMTSEQMRYAAEQEQHRGHITMQNKMQKTGGFVDTPSLVGTQPNLQSIKEGAGLAIVSAAVTAANSFCNSFLSMQNV